MRGLLQDGTSATQTIIGRAVLGLLLVLGGAEQTPQPAVPRLLLFSGLTSSDAVRGAKLGGARL